MLASSAWFDNLQTTIYVPRDCAEFKRFVLRREWSQGLAWLVGEAARGSESAAVLLAYLRARGVGGAHRDLDAIRELCRKPVERGNGFAMFTMAFVERLNKSHDVKRWIVRSVAAGFLPAMGEFARAARRTDDVITRMLVERHLRAIVRGYIPAWYMFAVALTGPRNFSPR